MTDRILNEGLTFDDVLLVPAYSEVLPREVNLKCQFTRNIFILCFGVESGAPFTRGNPRR